MATLVDVETAPYVLGLSAADLRRQMLEVSACFDTPEPPDARRLEFVSRRVEFVLRSAEAATAYPFADEFREPVHLVGLRLEVLDAATAGQVECSVATRWEAYCCQHDPDGDIAKTHRMGARMLMPTLPVGRLFDCIENEREPERAYSAALLEDRAEVGVLPVPGADGGVLVPERHGLAGVFRQMYGRPHWIRRLRLGALSPLGGRFLWLRAAEWRMLKEFAARFDAPPMQLRRLVPSTDVWLRLHTEDAKCEVRIAATIGLLRPRAGFSGERYWRAPASSPLFYLHGEYSDPFAVLPDQPVDVTEPTLKIDSRALHAYLDEMHAKRRDRFRQLAGEKSL